jgi:hypothetical protein
VFQGLEPDAVPFSTVNESRISLQYVHLLEKGFIAPAVDVAESFHMVGKTLGHYQISFQLGKGGMGEVYQAKGQKLGRDVAIHAIAAQHPLPGSYKA